MWVRCMTWPVWGVGMDWIALSRDGALPVVAAMCLTLTACGAGGGSDTSSGANPNPNAVVISPGQALAQCPLFPPQAVFNTRIDDVGRFPKHTRSDAWVSSVSGTRRFHPDWGNEANPAQWSSYYGIPFNVVDGQASSTDWAAIQFAASGSAPDESDCAVGSGTSWTIQRGCQSVGAPHFPIPSTGTVLTEGGACNDPATCGDHHLLVLESGACRLWEAYQGYRSGGQWSVSSVAAWDLNSMAMRPATWTSADAAGLPILPLLARADEASSGTVTHALRVTFAPSVMDGDPVWPASHRAGSARAGAIPLGAALRLKASFVPPSNWTTQAKALAVGMQRYGLYVADFGSNLFVQGEPNASWSMDTIDQLKTLSMSDFEFVDMRAVTGDARFNSSSYQAAW